MTDSITIGTVQLTRLQAFPVAWEDVDAAQGVAARRWEIDALVTPAEWRALVTTYETWRAARSAERDALASGSIGTTVTLSGSFAGLSWTNIACWFVGAPQQAPAGIWVRAQLAMVDAAQLLAAQQRAADLELERGIIGELSFGTHTVGGVTLNLLQPLDAGWEDGPKPERTSTGSDRVQGARGARRVRDIKGWTTSASAWDTLNTWYGNTIAASPASGDYWPEEPSLEVDEYPVAGVRTVRYIISLRMVQIR